MEELIKKWSESTGKIFTGVMMFSLLGIVDSLISPAISLIDAADTISSFMNDTGSNGLGATDAIQFLINLGIVAGYYFYFQGLVIFQSVQQSETDTAAIQRIKTAAILIAIGALLSIIPFVGGFLDGLLSLIGFILSIMAFSALKGSPTFPLKGRDGASKIFIALVLQIIAVCIGWIPIVNIISAILNVIAFVLILSGWATIRNSKPLIPEATTTVLVDETSNEPL